MQYEAFAELYDRLTFDVNYPQIADFAEQMFARYAVERPSLVLELACGTGSLTLELSHRGYDMIGVDVSADMLMAARQKMNGENILLLEQDMRSFELYGTVDAALCVLDSINYVTDGLEQVFRLVHNYLNPNGLFVFDINSEYKLRKVLAEQTFTYETEDIFYAWENQVEGDLIHFLLDFFVEQPNGDYRRFSEEHTERIYTREAVEKELNNAGFALLDCCDGYQLQPANPRSERLCYVCRALK